VINSGNILERTKGRNLKEREREKARETQKINADPLIFEHRHPA